jgi:hypothetical protein
MPRVWRKMSCAMTVMVSGAAMARLSSQLSPR